MTIPTITPLPTAPSRARPTTFEDEANPFLDALPTLAEETNASIGGINDAIADIEGKLDLAGFVATSTSEVTIATGSWWWTVQPNKLFTAGMFVMAVDQADADNWSYGQVVSYDSATGVLNVDVTATGGAGTISAWTVAPSSPRGAPGADGADGAAGADGADGVGVPSGGSDGQFLKATGSGTTDRAWATPTMAQITGLVAALAAKAGLTDDNTLTGDNAYSGDNVFNGDVYLFAAAVLRAVTGLVWENSGGADGAVRLRQFSGSTSVLGFDVNTAASPTIVVHVGSGRIDADAGFRGGGYTVARVASGTATNSGRISWGSAAPSSLDVGEIYLQY